MDLNSFKQRARGRVRPIVSALDRAGFSPLGVSIAGLVITALAG